MRSKPQHTRPVIAEAPQLSQATNTSVRERLKGRTLIGQWLLLGVALLLIGSAIGWNLYAERNSVDASERERLATQAKVIAENLGRQLLATNRALDSIRADLPFLLKDPKDGKAQVNRRLQAMCDAMAGVRTIAIMNADGESIASNRRELIGRDFRGAERFNAVRRGGNPATLYVSPPFRTPLGTYAIGVGKMVIGDRGEFAGVILAILDPDYFKTLLASVRYAPDMWTSIAHSDGKLFLFEPERLGTEEADLAKPGSFYTRHRDSGQQATVMTGTVYVTGEERMMAQRNVKPANVPMDKALLLAVSRDLPSVFAPWRKTAYQQAVLFLVLALVAGAGLFFHLRRLQADADLIEKQEAERKRVEETLRESESKYRRLIENSPDIVYLFSGQRGGIFYSPRVEAVLGYTPNQLCARPLLWSESIHPDDVTAVKRVVTSADGGKSFAVEYRIKDARGHWHWFLDRSTEVHTENGELLIEGLVTDITERKQIEDRNRQINVELEQQVAQRTHELQLANHELETFSYSVSHDLRAPLRAIEGFSSLLESEYASQLDGRAKDYFRRIRGGATRMAQLIDDLLNLSRISRQEMHHGQVNLSALAQEAADELQAAEPGRRVEWVIAPHISAEGDSGLMRIALQNLMGNAWKYSSKREIARIEFGVSQWNGNRAFFVRDNGEGFDMAHANKLFGAFQRLHSAEEFPGTGIGLATVARIVRRHGGAVGAEGTVHQGATFYFTL